MFVAASDLSGPRWQLPRNFVRVFHAAAVICASCGSADFDMKAEIADWSASLAAILAGLRRARYSGPKVLIAGTVV